MKAKNQRGTCLPDMLLMEIQQDYILHHMNMNSFLCNGWIVLHCIVTSEEIDVVEAQVWNRIQLLKKK